MKTFRDKLIHIRRAIHMHPELGNREFRTSSFVEKELKSLSMQTVRYGKTGIAGILRSSLEAGNTCFALRADMDALPVTTQITASYRSTVPGCMHACGHDGNMAMVLGAADVLSKKRNEFRGTVKFIFQPNEESAGGALDLIRQGVLKKPDVNAIAGIHVIPTIQSCRIGLARGAMMASVDRFILEIKGESGHGAYPHQGKDAIAIAAEIIQAFNAFSARRVDATEPLVVTVGTINGGERFNILAGSVTLEGTVRCLSRDLRLQLPKALEHIVKNITAVWHAGYAWRYENLGEILVNDDRMIDRAHDVAIRLFGRKRIELIKKPSMGGEDFSEYLRLIPGCFLYIGTKKNGKTSYPWHHPKFDIDESALQTGAEFLAALAVDFLT